MNRAREIDVLARTVYGMAKGKNEACKIAFAHIALNRARRGGWWGEDIVSVCLAAGQFTCWNEADPRRVKAMAADLDSREFMKALQIAVAVLLGREIDPTCGATHYYRFSTERPDWAAGKPEVRIGDTAFVCDVE